MKIEMSGLWGSRNTTTEAKLHATIKDDEILRENIVGERTAFQSQGYPRNSMDTRNRYVNNFESCLCSGQSTPALPLSHHNPINTS
jgi:hypothetical protein